MTNDMSLLSLLCKRAHVLSGEKVKVEQEQKNISTSVNSGKHDEPLRKITCSNNNISKKFP